MAAMDVLIRATDQASRVLENVGDAGEKSASLIEKHWVKASVALAAAGAAVEGLARSQAPLTAGTQRLAASIDMSEESMRDLIRATSDVTFPLDEVIGLMETGRQQGLETGQQLQEFAQFWDLVGDATGENAVLLGEAGVALRVMGIAAGEESEAIAAFGFITEETTTDVGEFLSIIERVGPDLNEMGLDIDDTAALLGVLERELGLSGTAARRELMEGVNEAEGSVENLFISLGITEEQLEEYNQKVEESSEILDRNADIHEESFTVMEQAQAAVADLAFQYGEQIKVVSNLVPLLVTLGPIIKTLTSLKGLLSIATKAQTIATKGLGVAMGIVTSPVFLVIAAITAAIAVAWLLYDNWEEVSERAKDLWESFKEIFVGIWESMSDWVGDIAGRISDFFTNLIDKIMDKVRSFRDSFLDVFRAIADGLKGPLNAAINGMNAVIRGLNKIEVSIPSWVPVFGGRSFGINIPTIPRLHTGGIFRAANPGGEGLAILRDGERVIPPGRVDPSPRGQTINFERGAFEGAVILDDFGVDQLMDRVIDRLQTLGVK